MSEVETVLYRVVTEPEGGEMTHTLVYYKHTPEGSSQQIIITVIHCYTLLMVTAVIPEVPVYHQIYTIL